jgi:hypothetical protein
VVGSVEEWRRREIDPVTSSDRRIITCVDQSQVPCDYVIRKTFHSLRLTFEAASKKSNSGYRVLVGLRASRLYTLLYLYRVEISLHPPRPPRPPSLPHRASTSCPVAPMAPLVNNDLIASASLHTPCQYPIPGVTSSLSLTPSQCHSTFTLMCGLSR